MSKLPHHKYGLAKSIIENLSQSALWSFQTFARYWTETVSSPEGHVHLQLPQVLSGRLFSACWFNPLFAFSRNRLFDVTLGCEATFSITWIIISVVYFSREDTRVYVCFAVNLATACWCRLRHVDIFAQFTFWQFLAIYWRHGMWGFGVWLLFFPSTAKFVCKIVLNL